tara:strand:+ start:1076 stop:1351 length:276 start_codon:yes stop_codon:yes gene_type:complete
MRAFVLIELLVVIVLISALISMTLYFRWDETEQKLNRELIRSEATKTLMLMRMDDPNPERGIWEWEDENGEVWIMFRQGTSVHNVGDIELP